MRNIQKCPIMWKLLRVAIPCSYPESNKCGRIDGSLLCRYRVAEIGLSSCLKEIAELQDFAKYLKK